jgi:hypothetical protein
MIKEWLKWIHYKRIIVIPFMLCFMHTEGFTKDNPEKVVQWHKWQHILTAQKKYDNHPAGLEVIFSGPGGITFRTPAFTDDGNTYCFRAAFPSSGIWEWKTMCTNPDDSGLHDQKGRVEVKAYSGKNPFYKHGDLKISNDHRYLIHSDGTPFLWMGETGWYVALKSTMKEWCEYIDIRADQKFSVIQVSPRRQIDKKIISAGGTVSFKEDGTPDPAFWKELEDKIEYANGKGLMVMLVGAGELWRKLFELNPKNQSFASYLTARLASHMVIFSPSFDELYSLENNMTAEELHQFTTHLVTQHPGTNYEANLKYQSEHSVDFTGLQSGHHNGNLARAYNAARSWTLDMWNGTPVKPVIDIEAMYDAYGNDNAKNWREKDGRKLGWIAWLSGAKGYTYGAGDIPPKVMMGAGGIWSFKNDPAAYDYWRKAINWPSAGQMTIMRNFFKSIEWWRLVPAPELIQNQAEDETLKMAVSKSADGNLILAYLPDNNFITLDLKDFSGEFREKWFNPKTGKFISMDKPVKPTSNVSFSKPDGWEDSVLLLQKL